MVPVSGGKYGDCAFIKLTIKMEMTNNTFFGWFMFVKYGMITLVPNGLIPILFRNSSKTILKIRMVYTVRQYVW